MKFKPREKLFRAWDPIGKTFVATTGFTILGEVCLLGVLDNYLHKNKPIGLVHTLQLEITESIGLLDSKKNKIYEGDILDIGMDYYALVEYNKKFASFGLRKKGWTFLHYFGEAVNPIQCTIVGNIYENPSLINP